MADFIVIAAIAGGVALAVRTYRKNMSGGCSCGCGGCAGKDFCRMSRKNQG